MKKLSRRTIRHYTRELLLLEDFIDGNISRKKFDASRFPYLITQLTGFLNDVEFKTSKQYERFKEKLA